MTLHEVVYSGGRSGPNPSPVFYEHRGALDQRHKIARGLEPPRRQQVRESGLMLVIRAVPGTAHAIATALDRARWPDVLGTIAGDDTLFVACTDAISLERTRKRLLRLGR